MASNRSKENAWASGKTKKPLNLAKQASSPNETSQKFREAQSKFQDAVQKHIKDYESSSDEEDINSTDVLGRPYRYHLVT